VPEPRDRPTRDRIVTAAVELLRERGYHAMGLKDLSVAAQAPTGSLYHFFPGGKAEIGEAAIRESGAAYQELFELFADGSIGGAGDMAEALVAFFDAGADVLEQQDYLDLCPIGTVAGEIASSDETLRVAARDVFDGWVEAGASRLRAQGLAAADAAALAHTIIATIEGSLILARTTRDTAAMRATGRHLAELVRAHAAASTRGAAAARGRASGRASSRSRGAARPR
jgi:AcrR family transcriptional regulator